MYSSNNVQALTENNRLLKNDMLHMSATKIDHIYFHCMDLTVTVVFKEKQFFLGGDQRYTTNSSD